MPPLSGVIISLENMGAAGLYNGEPIGLLDGDFPVVHS
jgi:hypothetical protein